MAKAIPTDAAPAPGIHAGALPTALMSSDERLSEFAEILAIGLQRLLARKSSKKSADRGENSLDISPEQSGHREGLAWENAG